MVIYAASVARLYANYFTPSVCLKHASGGYFVSPRLIGRTWEVITWEVITSVGTLKNSAIATQLADCSHPHESLCQQISTDLTHLQDDVKSGRYILRRYLPPASNSASVICPSEQWRTAPISAANTFSFFMAACLTRSSEFAAESAWLA